MRIPQFLGDSVRNETAKVNYLVGVSFYNDPILVQADFCHQVNGMVEFYMTYKKTRGINSPVFSVPMSKVNYIKSKERVAEEENE